MLTSLDAPNFRLVRVDLENPAPENWQELVPESDIPLESFVYAGGYLCLLYHKDAQNVIRVHDSDGAYLRDVPLPAVASLYDWTADWRVPEVFLGVSSYLTPPAVFRYDAATDALEPDMVGGGPARRLARTSRSRSGTPPGTARGSRCSSSTSGTSRSTARTRRC